MTPYPFRRFAGVALLLLVAGCDFDGVTAP
jgi:hypothetical protein